MDGVAIPDPFQLRGSKPRFTAAEVTCENIQQEPPQLPGCALRCAGRVALLHWPGTSGNGVRAVQGCTGEGSVARPCAGRAAGCLSWQSRCRGGTARLMRWRCVDTQAMAFRYGLSKVCCCHDPERSRRCDERLQICYCWEGKREIRRAVKPLGQHQIAKAFWHSSITEDGVELVPIHGPPAHSQRASLI